MKDNDFLINAVKCLVDAKSQLKLGTREQLQRVNCTAIEVYCKMALSFILKKDTGENITEITANISNVVSLIRDLMADKSFTETDTEIKEFINDKMMTALNLLCVVAGKYYTSEHKFDFNVQLTSVYNFIIDVCIDNSYYFGLEKDLGDIE